LESVVPALIERLHDPHQYVRYSVATSLGQLHTQPEIVVPALMNDFSGNDTLLRAKVLDALGQFGSQARAAIPMVLEALKDQNVSYNAAIAFKKIDPEAAAKAGVK
jgi:HEAT repeat protein